MNDTIAIRDGKVYVRTEFRMSSEPTVTVLYYPADLSPRSVLGGEQVMQTSGSGTYQLYDGFGLARRVFRLVHGGKTVPAFEERTPVQPPKVRKGTELRWWYGRWEKHSRRHGWQPAEG